MKSLLEASAEEGRENIKRARHNARCVDPEKLVPYQNTAMLALIRGTDALIDLAHTPTDG